MGLADKLKSGISKAQEIAKDSIDKVKASNAEAKAMKAPLEGSIERYGVTYVGGLTQYPTKKSGEIGLNIMPDRFIFTATSTTMDWFTGFEIPYDRIKNPEIVERTISNTEMLLSSSENLNSMQQKNNIEITYDNEEGIEAVLRVEMLTGTTIYGQAGKCREFMDKLRQNRILSKFKSNEDKASAAAQQSASGSWTGLAESPAPGPDSLRARCC